jgi:hypothetical protein
MRRDRIQTEGESGYTHEERQGTDMRRDNVLIWRETGYTYEERHVTDRFKIGRQVDRTDHGRTTQKERRETQR